MLSFSMRRKLSSMCKISGERPLSGLAAVGGAKLGWVPELKGPGALGAPAGRAPSINGGGALGAPNGRGAAEKAG